MKSSIIKTLSRSERRSRNRFPIVQDVRYQRLKGTKTLGAGTGKTLDMSSTAVRFTTDYALRPGDKVRVTMNWPALLEQTCAMKLVICGSVVRSDGRSAAVKIICHEFRTRAVHPLLFMPGTAARTASAAP